MGKKIVVVDDDSLISKTIDLCLRKKGYEVRVFDSGVDAVKHLVEERADSIVLDIRLPDCDGWFIAELMEKMDRSQGTPVIVLSVLDPDRRKVAEVKPYAYIQKPFDMRHLLQTVEASLGEGSPLVGA